MLVRKVVVNECGRRQRVPVIVCERRSREERSWNVKARGPFAQPPSWASHEACEPPMSAKRERVLEDGTSLFQVAEHHVLRATQQR